MPKSRKTTNFSPITSPDTELAKLKTNTGDTASPWVWNAPNDWVDVDSRRIVMQVLAGGTKMELTITATGQWTLTCKANVYANEHRFVYKLDAFTGTDQRLFTLVTPQAVASPANNLLGEVAEINLSGVSAAVRVNHGQIKKWVRRGAGEYRD